MKEHLKLNYALKISRLFLVIVILSTCYYNPCFSQSINDSIAVSLLAEIEARSEMANSKEYEKVIKYYFAVAPQKALDVCERWVEKAKNFKDKISETDALINLSKCNIILGKFDEAGTAALKGIKLAARCGYPDGEALHFGNLGVIAEMKGDNTQAIKHYLKADSVFAMTGNLKNRAFIENNLGIVYNNIQLFEKSLEYYNRALKHKIELRDTIGTASTYVNIGVLYESLKNDYNKALDFYMVAAVIYDKYGLLPQRATIYNNIGLIYLNTGDIVKSKESLINALKIREQIGDITGVASTKLNLALYSQKAHNINDQIRYAFESASIFEKAGVKPKLAESHKLLADAYETIGKPASSLYHLKQYVSLRDSVLNEENQKTVQELEAKYQNEVNQKKITILQQENRIGKLILIALILAFITISVTLFFIFRQIKLNNKHKQMKSELRILRMQMNPHFIFNSISSIQAYMLKNNSDAASAYLLRFATLMRSIMNQSAKDIISLKEEIETLENYFALENMRREEAVNCIVNVKEGTDTEDVFIPPMLVQPFVENSFKHAFKEENKGNKIEIIFAIEEDMLVVSIEDNGIGMNNSGRGPDGHISLATNIFRQRMEVMGKSWGKRVEFSIDDLAKKGGNGTRISFKIPA